MKIETILGAMQFAQTQSINLAMLERLDPYSANMVLLGRRERQWYAFRDRIIRMDSEKDEELIELRNIKAWVERPFDDPKGMYEKTNEEWSDG